MMRCCLEKPAPNPFSSVEAFPKVTATAKRKAGSDTCGISSVASSAWKSGYPSTRDTYKKERQVIGKLRRKKVRWKPSSSAEIVTYRIYWSTLGSVDFDSPYADLGKITEVTLPDGIPLSSLMAGAVGVGISAINNGGNESELAKTTVHFDFRAPQAPRNLTVEDV